MSIVATSKQLEEVCAQIDTTCRFSMDLEFIPERTYSPELCLVQIATDNNAYIIDPLSMLDLMPLWQKVADPNILVILHAAEHDLSIIHSRSGLIAKNIIDTQIAAGFIGYGYPVGYGKLLQQLLRVSISKTECMTDWLVRPLSDAQIQYAIDDVRYLLPIYDKLSEKLIEAGRESWVLEECNKYSSPEYYLDDRKNSFLRIKGANSLSSRGLAILSQLCLSRDEEARRINKPIRSILSDVILLDLSKRPPKTLEQIQQMRGIRQDQARQHGDLILNAVKLGLAIPDEECPIWPSYKMPPKRDALICDVLYAIQKVICYELDLSPELVATRSDLEKLVRLHNNSKLEEGNLPLLHGWRREILGQKLIDLLTGATVNIQLIEGHLPVSMSIDKFRL